ncbi:phosphate acyltransferase PlsX [Thermopolyspora sp. NPDC052614]|uniref:phosphate acyltransferase n=1 Tax=Thermopolyspora sp. NPDC052614 TaxID=3155682 RepID=UPI003422DFEE
MTGGEPRAPSSAAIGGGTGEMTGDITDRAADTATHPVTDAETRQEPRQEHRAATGGATGAATREATTGATGGVTAERRTRGNVVLDGMGGDHGPAEAVAGAVLAHRVHGVPVLLTGREADLLPLLRRHDAIGEIPVVHAPDAVPMSERGTAASPDSSLAIGCELVRDGTAAALVSAGSTGAVVSCAMRSIGRAEDVARPALAVALPQLGGGTSILIDAGATPDPTPEMIGRFALLGVEYARNVLGVAAPVAGLLSIGSEPGKGNRLTRGAAQVLAETPVRFHGMIEGHDVLAGVVDVIVTDGFTGNVVLKTIEGCVRTTLAMVAAAGPAPPPALAEVGGRYDPRTHGGAALLGLRGTVVVAHGSSTAETIARACVVAHALARVPPASAATTSSGSGPVREGHD